MAKISRAGDTLWSVSAFDPRKPVDPDWASKPPAPVLRSGVEPDILDDSPYEHHQGTDQMQWGPEGHGADESVLDFFDNDRPQDYYLGQPNNTGLTSQDLLSISQHNRNIRGSGGRLEGSQGHYVEYHPSSSVNHYYTYNPRHSGDQKPWNLVSTHPWAVRDAIQSRHESFDEAVAQGIRNRKFIDRRVR